MTISDISRREDDETARLKNINAADFHREQSAKVESSDAQQN
jgi:hypothetical protein